MSPVAIAGQTRVSCVYSQKPENNLDRPNAPSK